MGSRANPRSSSARPVSKTPATVNRSFPIDPSAAGATRTASSPAANESWRAISRPTINSFALEVGSRPSSRVERMVDTAGSRAGSIPMSAAATVASPELTRPPANTRGVEALTKGSAATAAIKRSTSVPSLPPIVS